MDSHRRLSQMIGACALAGLAATIAACGSSSPSGSSTSSTKPSSGASSSSPTAAITTNWQAFFNAATPTSTRVSLLEDGQEFATVIQTQSHMVLAKEATAKVSHVTVNSPTQATVIYDILIDGSPALKNQKGVAVYQDGTWKVGVASFCGLLIDENSGKTSGLPTACKSAT
jgi:hypothetical protein